MKVAVLGCGTIGRGVVNILLEGVKGIELKKILDRKQNFDNSIIELYTDNIDDIINDESIDTVVETMGGRGFSYSCVKRALESGKNVVTANKELVAYNMRELYEIANAKGSYLLYEASVGGGIPFMKTIANLSEYNKVRSIVGILNGTTNYILTKMQKDRMSYDEALKEAQRLGFAESDPAADVDGHDLARKIAILSMLCYKEEINIEDVYTFGIRNVTPQFIDYADTLGYALKFVCFSEVCDDKLEIGVEPILVKRDSVIGNIQYENNIVTVDMKPNDEITFIGKGAGRMPTASAIVADLQVIRDKGQKMEFVINNKLGIGFIDKNVSALVMKNGEIEFNKGVSAKAVRNGGYDFYAIVYNQD